MRRGLLALLACGVVVCAAAPAMDRFGAEEEASRHCPKDSVVWLNLPTMIWHYKGERWYGNTKHGAYVCEKEAAAEGARATRNGE